jgi:23S rRNA pseudouridine2605 synthase
MRLAKYLASAGVASRRASETIVRSGRVTVGGFSITDPACDVGPEDVVAVDGKPITETPQRVVYALNKPTGVVSTARDPQRRPTVVSLVPSDRRLYPVGRLDADTTGLILLTNDGELAHRLTHPSFEVPRTYRATVGGGPVREAALQALRSGVKLADGMTAPARVRRLGPHALELTIHEGRKRQVKRMCEAVGHPVRQLERVAFGPLKLGELAPGRYRPLRPDEVAKLSAAPTARPRAGSSSEGRGRPLKG